jgi:hypothetical protein
MARGKQRNASYQGVLGTTRTEKVHIALANGPTVAVEVFVGIDAVEDPALARQAFESEPDRALNAVAVAGDRHLVNVSFVYHDPRGEVFALVVPEALRHRELHERAALLAALAEDTSCDVPDYVRNHAVVFGPAGLRRFLEQQAETDLEEARRSDLVRELDRRTTELRKHEVGLDLRADELERFGDELDNRERELDRRGHEIGDLESSLADRERALADREQGIEQATRVEPAVHEQATQVARKPADPEAATTNPVELIDAADLEEIDEADEITSPQDPPAVGRRADTGATRLAAAGDVELERWVRSANAPTLKVVNSDGVVRFAASASRSQLQPMVGDQVDALLQLHRLPSYPIVTSSIGHHDVLSDFPGPEDAFTFSFDIANDRDRAVLESLAKEFRILVEMFDSNYEQLDSKEITTDLAENVGYVLAMAHEHLATIDESDRSFERALLAYSEPDYDRFGNKHSERGDFNEAKLSALTTAMETRRAVAIARRFTAPDNESFLVLCLGYPLARWRKHRVEVLSRAIDLGLWMGSTLAQVAVSEGLARSRKELVATLQRSFAHLIADPHSHDIDEDAVRDNWADLDKEARRLGIHTAELAPRSKPIDSAEEPSASGMIGTVPLPTTEPAPAANKNNGHALPVHTQTVDALVGLLEDKDHRLNAAIELAKRGAEPAIGPVFQTLARMTRGEAGRVLGSVMGFGQPAVPHLLSSLQSHKGYIRQGAALALGVLKDEEGIEAICDLLVAEPTEIWREVARAIGQVGAGAVMSLLSRLAKSNHEEARERVAWALAHVAARGGASHIQTLTGGRDPVAAGVARHALELADLAASDDVAVRGQTAPRDQTVNRAFSRRFFEAMDNPVQGHTGSDISAPALLLDESDLLEADDSEPLDDNDLIPT